MWNSGHMQCLRQREESKKTRTFHPQGDVLILPVLSAAAHHYNFKSVYGNFSCPLRLLRVCHWDSFLLAECYYGSNGKEKGFRFNIFSLLTPDRKLVPQQGGGGARAKGLASSSTLKDFSVTGMTWCHQLQGPCRKRENNKICSGFYRQKP